MPRAKKIIGEIAPTPRSKKLRRSEYVPAQAQRQIDDEFIALLRRKCTRAAATGALTAAIGAIPGLGRALGFVFGEVLDAQFLARVQRELIEDTFTLYGLELAAPLRSEIVSRVQTLGTSASIAGDALVRGVLRRSTSSVGGLLARRILPLASIVSSAASNASITYAIGKRAQAVAKWRDGPITGMPDVMRAFSGVDERRILDWTGDAVKTSLGMIGGALKRVLIRPKARKKKTNSDEV